MFEQKRLRPQKKNLCGRRFSKRLLLLLFRRRRGSLCSLGFGETLLEFIHSPSGIDELLHAGVKGVAHVANADHNDGFRRTGLDHVATSATNFRILILRMNVSSHKKGW